MHEDSAREFDPQRPTAEMLLWAYRQGAFPMVNPEMDVVEWFSPDPRGIIPLDAFHVPGNLARLVRRGILEVTTDCDFQNVARECAAPRSEENASWMNETLLQAYIELAAHGFAHSVEAHLDGALVGGLYGVHIGTAFFGESMFCKPEQGGSNASKVCLVHLMEMLRSRGFTLLDTQFWNEHLDQFGCVEITREEYLNRLFSAVHQNAMWPMPGVIPGVVPGVMPGSDAERHSRDIKG